MTTKARVVPLCAPTIPHTRAAITIAAPARMLQRARADVRYLEAMSWRRAECTSPDLERDTKAGTAQHHRVIFSIFAGLVEAVASTQLVELAQRSSVQVPTDPRVVEPRLVHEREHDVETERHDLL